MVLSIWAVLWFSSRLYRVGILMYGKRRHHLRWQLLRWLRVQLSKSAKMAVTEETSSRFTLGQRIALALCHAWCGRCSGSSDSPGALK